MKYCENGLKLYILFVTGQVTDNKAFIELLTTYLQTVQCPLQQVESIRMLKTLDIKEKPEKINNYLHLSHAVMFGDVDLVFLAKTATMDNVYKVTEDIIQCKCSLSFTTCLFSQYATDKIRKLAWEYLCFRYICIEHDQWLFDLINNLCQKLLPINVRLIIELIPTNKTPLNAWNLLVLCAVHVNIHKKQLENDSMMYTLSRLNPYESLSDDDENLIHLVSIKICYMLQTDFISLYMFHPKYRCIIVANIALTLMKNKSNAYLIKTSVDNIASQLTNYAKTK